jgi:hypothetical protein
MNREQKDSFTNEDKNDMVNKTEVYKKLHDLFLLLEEKTIIALLKKKFKTQDLSKVSPSRVYPELKKHFDDEKDLLAYINNKLSKAENEKVIKFWKAVKDEHEKAKETVEVKKDEETNDEVEAQNLEREPVIKNKEKIINKIPHEHRKEYSAFISKLDTVLSDIDNINDKDQLFKHIDPESISKYVKASQTKPDKIYIVDKDGNVLHRIVGKEAKKLAKLAGNIIEPKLTVHSYYETAILTQITKGLKNSHSGLEVEGVNVNTKKGRSDYVKHIAKNIEEIHIDSRFDKNSIVKNAFSHVGKSLRELTEQISDSKLSRDDREKLFKEKFVSSLNRVVDLWKEHKYDKDVKYALKRSLSYFSEIYVLSYLNLVEDKPAKLPPPGNVMYDVITDKNKVGVVGYTVKFGGKRDRIGSAFGMGSVVDNSEFKPKEYKDKFKLMIQYLYGRITKEELEESLGEDFEYRDEVLKLVNDFDIKDPSQKQTLSAYFYDKFISKHITNIETIFAYLYYDKDENSIKHLFFKPDLSRYRLVDYGSEDKGAIMRVTFEPPDEVLKNMMIF